MVPRKGGGRPLLIGSWIRPCPPPQLGLFLLLFVDRIDGSGSEAVAMMEVTWSRNLLPKHYSN